MTAPRIEVTTSRMFNAWLAGQRAREAPNAARRDWAFPLYPPAMIDEPAEAVSAEWR